MSGMGLPCRVCTHPDRLVIEGELARMPSIAQVAALHPDLSKHSMYRHVKGGHVGRKEATALDRAPTNGNALAPGTQAEISATLRDARRLFNEARRHLKLARSADDLKATNGAISAATKALELVGRLRGELQALPNATVNVTLEMTQAVDSQRAALEMGADDTIAEAEVYLMRMLEAGDAHAVQAVGRLLRSLPSARFEASASD